MKNIKGAKKWNELSLAIKTVLVDFVYNGYTRSPRPMLAGSTNNINELISYIKDTPELRRNEDARSRIKYLESQK